MAVIALSGNTIGCCIGIGSFEGVGTAFSSAKQSVKLLKQGISTLKSKIDTARVAANVDTSHTQAQNAEKREETKQSALTTGYDKLENLISDVSTVDNKSADKIQERKNDFYAQYSYLKPECEKSKEEKRKEFWQGVGSAIGNFFGGIGKAIADFCIGIGEWCKEVFSNLISAITAIVIIAAAIVICVLCAPEVIAIIAIIVCAASAVYGLVDIGFMLCNNGKDIPTLLEENGHGNWAAFVRGLDFGFTVASFILPVGGAIKTSMMTGSKTFIQATGEWFKNSFKGLANSFKNIGQSIKNVFTCSGKPGFKGMIQSVGMSLWSGFKSITGIDDVLRLKELRNFSKCKPGWLINYNSNDWLFDKDNMILVPQSDRAHEVISEANKAYCNAGSEKIIESLPLTKNSGYIDLNWDDLSVKTLGKSDGFSMKNLDISKSDPSLRYEIYGGKFSRVNQALNGEVLPKDPSYKIFTSNGASKGGEYNVWGFTSHENFNFQIENIVPTFIHNTGKGGNGAGIFHHGGIDRLHRLVDTADIINNDFVRNIIVQISEKFSIDVIGEN
ncbi:MAG: hypothetical protein K2J26_02335 [Ruminococcus sp.]|nr:hypothetical protein [Ruminococcus sp.]